MNFGTMRRAFRDRFVIIALAIVLGLVGGGMVAKAVPQKYTATATMLFIPVGGDSLTDVGQGSQFVESQLKTLSVVGTASEFLQPIIKANGLKQSVPELAGQLNVSSQANTLIMTVEATNPDQKTAVTVANAVADSLLKDINEYTPLSGAGRGVMGGKILDKADSAAVDQAPSAGMYALLGMCVGLLAGLAVSLVLGEKASGPARSDGATSAPATEV